MPLVPRIEIPPCMPSLGLKVFCAVCAPSGTRIHTSILDGEKILNENTNENGYSTFTIPVTAFDSEMSVIADTTAMGTPHEIAYALTFYADSIESKGALPQEAAKRVLVVAAIIIVGGGILNHFVAKRRNRDYTPHKKTGK